MVEPRLWACLPTGRRVGGKIDANVSSSGSGRLGEERSIRIGMS
ncbi:MAG: hypothetical protein ABSC13_02515 [Dehalococcoidia bacterium]